MLYEVTVYQNGFVHKVKSIEAKNHEEAARLASIGLSFSHMRVAGKTKKRYNREFKEVKAEPKFYPAYARKQGYSILVMRDNLPEFSVYKSKTERDDALKCITSTYAESVKAKEALTDITAYSEETSGSESGLTFPKTSSGSATSATWRDWLTRENTDKPSGSVSVDVMATTAWPSGLSRSHSKRDQTFLATVQDLSGVDPNPHPGTNSKMVAMAGKTIKVKMQSKDYFLGDGWVWKKEWLDFSTIKAKIKFMDNPKDTRVAFLDSMKATMGETYHFKKCECGCDAFFNGHFYYDPKWLEPSDEEALNDRQNVETSREEDSIYSRRRKSTRNGTGAWFSPGRVARIAQFGSKAPRGIARVDYRRIIPSGSVKRRDENTDSDTA